MVTSKYVQAVEEHPMSIWSTAGSALDARKFAAFVEDNSKNILSTVGSTLGASLGGVIEVYCGGMTCGLATLLGKRLGETSGGYIGEAIAGRATDSLLGDIPEECPSQLSKPKNISIHTTRSKTRLMPGTER